MSCGVLQSDRLAGQAGLSRWLSALCWVLRRALCGDGGVWGFGGWARVRYDLSQPLRPCVQKNILGWSR